MTTALLIGKWKISGILRNCRNTGEDFFLPLRISFLQFENYHPISACTSLSVS